MKRRGVGKALVDAMNGKGKEQEKSSEGVSPLMNQTRQRILELLSDRPCNTMSGIAKEMALSLQNTKWHLNKLVESDYITKKETDTGTIYYPEGLIDPSDVILLSELTRERDRSVYTYISTNPGASQADVSKTLGLDHRKVLRIVMELERLGAIDTVEDGRNKRYFPSDIIQKKVDRYNDRSKDFVKHLTSRLASEGIKTELERSTQQEAIIHLVTRKETRMLRITTNPFFVLMQERS